MRPQTKERYFPISSQPPKHVPGKAGQLKANSGIKNKAVMCPECKSMNCKQRTFNIKCYNCGVIIDNE